MIGPANKIGSALRIEPGTVATLADLGAVLRSLRRREARRRHGRELTYRQLAERTGWSLGIIGDYLSGTALPPTDRFDTLVLLFGATGEELGPLASARDRVADGRQRARAEPVADPPGPGDVRVVPHELRAPPSRFVGRAEHLSRLDTLLRDGTGAAVPLAVVTGMAGVGKTALALRWAQRVAAEMFPDGQLYVDLRGYDPAEPVDPAHALAGFLRALGVGPDQVPLDGSERAARYRTLVAGRRMLIVLDNAHSSEQVRPLLPGSALCTVVVTSRDSLAGITSTEGALRVPLSALSVTESTTLLRALVGPRVDGAPEAAEALVEHCGRLPLAIRIAAELAAIRADEPLARLVEDLRDERARLDALDTGEERSTVRSVLSWSYRALPDRAAWLFRLLGAVPGPDLPLAAVASLAGVDRSVARRTLAELTRAHMVTETAPGRYGFHDVLRAYAAELADADTDQAARRAAVRRLLDHYLRGAVAADRWLEPSRLPIELVASADGVVVEATGSEEDARAWFDAELATLLEVIGLAHAQGHTAHVWQLPWAIANHLDQSGRWHELTAINTVALDATGDPAAQARIRHSLARAAVRLGQVDTALEHYLTALALLQGVGDEHGQALAHTNIAGIYGQSGRLRDASRHSEQALGMFQRLGNTMGQALALNNLGYTLALLGEHPEALHACRRALALFDEIGERPTQAYTWDTLGYVHRRQGDLDQAARCYRNAVALHAEGGDRLDEATAWTQLGDTSADGGEHGAATDAWRSALAILDDLDHPDAEGVRCRLDAGLPPAA